MSVSRQCELLGLARSSYYYGPQPDTRENLHLLRQFDELYLKHPFYGSRRMAVQLEVNRKRMQRLMRILGVQALYPKPNLSRPAPGHEIYPYLCADSRSIMPITSGARISRTFRCAAAFST